jgi:aminoglycoside phosphotransferase (APT) family kinase protein
MPTADVEVSLDLVHRLLLDQHPDLAGRPLAVIANGWDNVMCGLGDDLVVRVPRRELAAQLIRHELRWLPDLAPRLPLPIPAPVRAGRPALGYPWAWSIVPFLPGDVAARRPPADLPQAADALGRFLGALHVPAPPDAPVNRVRGVPLAERSEALHGRLARLGGVVDPAAVLEVWEAAVQTPVWAGPPVWLHGDLHPANILVDGGRISAVIDFGDITSGDPATDLSVAWMLLPPATHRAFRAGYGAASERPIDGETWARARGWAVGLSLAVLAHSADNPLMAGIGERTLAAALA